MAYSLKYSYNSSTSSYSVTGNENITQSDMVVIPDIYDDGTNGSHPVTIIASRAFKDCINLTNIVIPEGVTTIGSESFWGCTGLTSITIPTSVASISYYVFSGSNLTSIYINDLDSWCSISFGAFINNKYSLYLNNKLINKLNISDNITSIGQYTFYNCSSLVNVTMGNRVESIGIAAFSGCSNLTNITIPNSVTSIGNGAFRDCSSLKQLILFPSTPPTLGSSAIPNTIFSIYVQQSSLESYKLTTNWNSYANKIVSNDLYLSFANFNSANKEYISKKLSDKLTAPTTPTAESAVVLGTDGTVSTKPLSEIGGRKLYRHYIRISVSGCSYESLHSVTGAGIVEDADVYITLYTTNNEKITSKESLYSYVENKNILCSITTSNQAAISCYGCVSIGFSTPPNLDFITGILAGDSGDTYSIYGVGIVFTVNSDTVTEV